MRNRIVAISTGDPAGVGPEITLKSFLSERVAGLGTAVVVGDYAVLEAVRDKLAIPVRLQRLESVHEVGAEKGTVPVLDVGVIRHAAELEVGRVSALAGRASVEYVRRAVDLCLTGEASGLVTGPINKEALREGRQDYIGHTEMISQMSNGKKGITMFQVDRMKIFFHSRHLSLRRAIEAIDRESVLESLILADRCLGSIGYLVPKLALAALNPHASDGGLFGDEEERCLIPARRQAVDRGLRVAGPIPADSVFAQALEGRYDAVLSLYHDQGHVAAKTYDFFRTVSVTFGYPFLRTSVDHGTALDIAWRGVANPVSMEEAIAACFSMAPKYRPIYGA
ncbi:MAG TPA: 4-hydroxythreonine-4-phosphate dehydrogenase PdxA [Sediminispirochaeta sp.]|nr:4-hydroxythreonine-4-phosphate dehydrogenase PdxA [Sediminispirochaeta sp.]